MGEQRRENSGNGGYEKVRDRAASVDAGSDAGGQEQGISDQLQLEIPATSNGSLSFRLSKRRRADLLEYFALKWHGSTRGRRQASSRRLRHEWRTLATSTRPTPE